MRVAARQVVPVDAQSLVAGGPCAEVGLTMYALAKAAGVTQHRFYRWVSERKLVAVFGGVYRLPAAPVSFEMRLAAACLWAGRGAVASHRAAGALWRLEDIGAAPAEITVPRLRGVRTPGVDVHRSRDLAAEDVRVRSGIPVTSAARTLIDLASVLDPLSLAINVEDAWRRGIATPDWVFRRLSKLRRKGRPGIAALNEVLDDCAARGKPLRSALEVRVWWLIKRSGLPLPIPGCAYEDPERQPGEIDFAYPGANLAIEAMGFSVHGTRSAFEADTERTARLAALGWRVFQVTRRQVDETPGEVVERLRRALKGATSSTRPRAFRDRPSSSLPARSSAPADTWRTPW